MESAMVALLNEILWERPIVGVLQHLTYSA